MINYLYGLIAFCYLLIWWVTDAPVLNTEVTPHLEALLTAGNLSLPSMEAFTLVILHCFATNPIPLFSFSKRHKDFQWDFPALENLPKSILPRVELKRSITIISFEQGEKKNHDFIPILGFLRSLGHLFPLGEVTNAGVCYLLNVPCHGYRAAHPCAAGLW